MNTYIRLTNLSNILKVQKHLLRLWIKTLEPLSSRKMKERSASEFSIIDLFFLRIVSELNKTLGLKIEIISLVSSDLYKFIENIKSLKKDSSLWIVQENESRWMISKEPKSEVLCFSIPLGRLWMEVEDSLGLISLRTPSLLPFTPNKKNKLN